MFNDQLQSNPGGDEKIKDAISTITERLIKDFPPAGIICILDGVHKACKDYYDGQIQSKVKDLEEFKNLAAPLFPKS